MANNTAPDPTTTPPAKEKTTPEKDEQFGGFADRSDEAKTADPDKS